MKKKSSNSLTGVLSGSIYFLVILIIVLIVVTFIGQRVKVIGASMSPTLEDADGIIVDKISYRIGEPERFDIIVFPYKYEPNTTYIKRVIGLPGETVYIDNEGKIYINDTVLEEGYGNEVIKNPGMAYKKIELGEDEYFVMGDNRNNSSDSRDPNVGNIKRSEIIGKAFLRIYPFDKMGVIKHR